jgi:hypothetical protein
MPSPAREIVARDAHANIPFVTFTWSRDVHYAKALLGSIRHFYPDRRIIVVAERDLPRHHARQIATFPNAEVIPVMDLVRRHKLHFVGLLNKLNVLLLPDAPRAIVADADSILVDKVADRVDAEKVFTAFTGSTVDLEIPEQRKIYHDWAISLDHAWQFDEGFPRKVCRYVQGCHFAVNTERFPYDLLYRMLPHLAFRHGDPAPLRAGDQGFWNLLINWSGLQPEDCEALPVTMSSTASQADLFKPEWNTVDWIERRESKEISFVHYIGGGRRFRRCDHVCPTPLEWGTALYYEAIGRRAYVPDEIRRTLAPVMRRLNRMRSVRAGDG